MQNPGGGGGAALFFLEAGRDLSVSRIPHPAPVCWLGLSVLVVLHCGGANRSTDQMRYFSHFQPDEAPLFSPSF